MADHHDVDTRAEVEDAQLARLRTLARSLRPEDRALVPPPASVWEAITTSLADGRRAGRA